MGALMLALALAAPGELIELRGTAVYEWNGAVMESHTICRFAVASPVYSRPVYAARPETLPPGITRTWYQRVGLGYIRMTGIVLTDGRVLTEFGDVVDLETSGGVL